MAKPNQVADLNEKRAARGAVAMTLVQMVDFLHVTWANDPWPPNWPQRIVDHTPSQAQGGRA